MTPILTDVKEVLLFMKSCGVRMRFFMQSLGLSLALTIFALYTVSLLFPLVQDVISGDFSNVRGMKIIGHGFRSLRDRSSRTVVTR